MSPSRTKITAGLAALLLAGFTFATPAACVEDVKSPTGAATHWNVPALLVRDLDRSAAWYEGYLGFARVSERLDGEARSLVLSRGTTLLHLRAMAVDVTGSIGAAPTERARRALTLLVGDVDETVAELQDRGLELLSTPQDDDEGRYRTATITDPDGNPILLSEPLPPGS
ncbi:MAG TPA: VOC family protein [Microvirga sp.]|jgi:catechol 2,3-dioxygenase-like lactoylglutathione lyase family enzyme|nr:VOC family protein [Microvirga sp.]